MNSQQHLFRVIWFTWFTSFVGVSAQFRGGVSVGSISDNTVNEASGLAASWRNEGVLWTHNDSGDGPIIYAITVNGEYLGAYNLNGINNRDLEDIAIGPGPEDGESYIYLGDIGNNDFASASRDNIKIFRVKEPPAPSGGNREHVDGVDTITLTYPSDEEYIDAETLMVDPILGEIYVLRKELLTTSVYSTPPDTTSIPGSFSMTLEYRGFMGSVSSLTGGDISRTGQEILMKRLNEVYYFVRKDYESVSDALTYQDDIELAYNEEVQGEAITFATDLSGYYTLSESGGRNSVPLLFYSRDGRVPYWAGAQEPTTNPTFEPTPSPTFEPTPNPTFDPTPSPTFEPTPNPTQQPTPNPTLIPTFQPTPNPTFKPTKFFSTTAISVTVPLPPPSTSQPSVNPATLVTRPILSIDLLQPPSTHRPTTTPTTTPNATILLTKPIEAIFIEGNVSDTLYNDTMVHAGGNTTSTNSTAENDPLIYVSRISIGAEEEEP